MSVNKTKIPALWELTFQWRRKMVKINIKVNYSNLLTYISWQIVRGKEKHLLELDDVECWGVKERKFVLLNRVGGIDLNEEVTFEERLRGLWEWAVQSYQREEHAGRGHHGSACIWKHLNSYPYGTIIALCIWNSLLIFKTHEAIVISWICKSLSHTLSPLVITTPIIAPILQMWPLRQ